MWALAGGGELLFTGAMDHCAAITQVKILGPTSGGLWEVIKPRGYSLLNEISALNRDPRALVGHPQLEEASPD